MRPAPDTPTALVALDVGTSVVKACAWRDGVAGEVAREPVDLHLPGAGRAEQDARALAAASTRVVEAVVGRLAPGERRVLGLCNQRSTVVLWDAETGAPLGPALSWRDARATEEASRMARRVPDLARRTGLHASPHYGAPKIAWALSHWPDARTSAERGTLRVGPVGTWVAWTLSRGESFTVDPTNAQRMLLLDLKALAWDQELLEAAGVPPEALPRVLPTDGEAGLAHVAGMPLALRAAIGDQQAVLAAASDHAARVARVQLGTGGFVLREVGDEPAFVPGLLAGIARADAHAPRRYLVEGTIQSAGSAFDRLRAAGVLRDGEDVDAACAGARAPVTVVPAWAGLGAPWWSPRAQAVLSGWDESSTRADLVAGTVRGVAFLVADVVDAMAAGGVEVDRLALSGSASRSRALAQTVADATRRPVVVRDDGEASLAGVAAILAHACGATPPRHDGPAAREHVPGADLGAARARFAAARDAERLRAGAP